MLVGWMEGREWIEMGLERGEERKGLRMHGG